MAFEKKNNFHNHGANLIMKIFMIKVCALIHILWNKLSVQCPPAVMLDRSKSLKSLWGIQLITVMLKLCNEIKDTVNAVKVAETLIPNPYSAGSIVQLPSTPEILDAWYWQISFYARSVIPTSACCLGYQPRKFLFRINS